MLPLENGPIIEGCGANVGIGSPLKAGLIPIMSGGSGTRPSSDFGIYP